MYHYFIVYGGYEMGRRKEAEKFEIDHFLMESLRKEYRDLERILEELRDYASSYAADSVDYKKLIEHFF